VYGAFVTGELPVCPKFVLSDEGHEGAK